MLKDVADSKRINTNIIEKKEKEKRSGETSSEDRTAAEEVVNCSPFIHKIDHDFNHLVYLSLYGFGYCQEIYYQYSIVQH